MPKITIRGPEKDDTNSEL